MKVVVYKVGSNRFPIKYGVELNDKNFAQTEIKNVINLLVDNNHDVDLYTDRENVKSDKVGVFNLQKKYDVALVFNGPIKSKQMEEKKLMHLVRCSEDVRYVLTDMRLILPKDLQIYFNKTLTQSFQNIDEIITDQSYNGMPQSILYGNKEKYKNINKEDKDKGKMIFGGTERNRTDDFIEYIYRPNIEFYGKSPTLGLEDNRLPVDRYMRKLEKAQFTIVIADKKYNDNNFITQRFYEAILNKIVPFIDSKYDKGNYIIDNNSFLRVSSYKEMILKANAIKSNKNLYEAYLKYLEKYAKEEYFSGKYTAQKLLK